MQFATFNAKEIILANNSGQKIRDLQDPEKIKQALRYVFTLIGLKAENIPSDLQRDVLIEFIKTEMSSFSPEEIVLAFRQAVSKKFEANITHFQNFSAVYLSEVMESYRIYRNAAMTEFNQNLKRIESNNKEEVSEERKQFHFWEYVETVLLKIWDEFEKTGRLNFGTFRIATIFDTLESDFGILALTVDQKIEIKKRAEQIIRIELSQPSESLQKVREIRNMKEAIDSGSFHLGFETEVIRKCKEIAIRDFFSSLKAEGKSLRKIIEEIRPKFKYKR
jgi:hypothetical protein